MFRTSLFMSIVSIVLVVFLFVGISRLVVAPPLHILAVYSEEG